MGKIDWRKILIIGASSGIGEALARRLGRPGATLALVARRRDRLEALRDEIQAQGGSAHPFVHDVAEAHEVADLLPRIIETLGGLDLVVYAAGVMPRISESEYDFETDRQIVTVNMLGAMAWLDPLAARFEAERRGTIIGISSIAGERGRRGNPAYCSSKAGLSCFLESLRNRLTRHGVSVVTIKPGFVDTPMTQGMEGLFWLISADQAARQILAKARRRSASAFVPRRWSLVAFVVRSLPSIIFRRLDV